MPISAGLSFFLYLHPNFIKVYSVNKNKTIQKKKLWQHPWRYKESFLVVMELALLGLIFEVLTGGKGAPQLQWPVNAIVGVLIISSVGIIYYKYRKNPVIKWLASVPAAISAISFFAIVSLLLGFIPQDVDSGSRFVNMLGLSHMKNSWLMMVSGLYFLIALGFVTMRRSLPLNRKNIGFLLNHAGLWITIAAGYLGAGDLEKKNLRLVEGNEATNIAMNMRTGTMDELPFSVQLLDFNIEDYNPKIAIVNASSGTLVEEEGNTIQIIEEGLKTNLLDWEVEILEFMPDAFALIGKDEYVAKDSMGSAPAALVRATHSGSGTVHEGWISCGSFGVMFASLELGNNTILAMTTPEPQKYSSDLVIKDNELGDTEVRVEVNKPYKHKGWKLYQLSYDERMGKWSQLSVMEAVRDPWLPLVYTGIFMLLAGAAYIFWTGNKTKG